ncbi:AAA family ATPase [Leptotrichia massiliensis]|uniref:AAA family ATPase n=1 Tax=Leptotrichia massiliensis TaxID=1852388 RepID=UPI0028D08DE9|nr:AAA family ATPase [Leptotrichia massiliensis]
MFPIYMYVEEYKGLKDFEITFDNNYEIKYNREKDTLSINKKCESVNNNIEIFYSIERIKGNIDSVNLLIGKNGSGKTSILEMLNLSYHYFRNKSNIILYKSQKSDKDFILENSREGADYGATKFIKAEKFQNMIIKNTDSKNYYTKNTGVIKLSFKETKMNAILRDSKRYLGSSKASIYKLNIGLENGSRENMYNYLIKRNQEKHDNFENAYITLLIPNLYIELKKSQIEKIKKESNLNTDEIDNFFKLYDYGEGNLKNKILNNYFNFIYLKYSKKILEKEKLKERKNKLLELLKSESSTSRKIEILFEKNQIEFDEYEKKIYNTIEKVATIIDSIPKEEINIQDSEILKKFKINCKEKSIKIIELLKEYDSFYIPKEDIYEDLSLKEVEFIKIDEEGLSDGEKIKLQYFSTLHGVLNGEFKNRKYITLLFDEVETYLHPEWSRRFLYELIEELGRYEDKKFKLIFATHSPFLIADVLAKDCIYLSKDEEGKIKAEIKEDVKTFGANIIDLFKNTMFLESTFGKFATEKIKGVVDKIEKAEKYSDIKHEVDFIIGKIGEKLISNKLKSMIESKFENKYEEEKDEEYYRKKIEEYQAKLEKLGNKENNKNS